MTEPMLKQEKSADQNLSDEFVRLPDNAVSAKYTEQVNQALQEKAYLTAEFSALAAICARPDFHRAYHLLGTALEAQGHDAEARCCYQGELPHSIIDRMGLVQREKSAFKWPDCQRVYVHTNEVNQFKCPEFSGAVPRAEFSRTTYQSTPTSVDTLKGGVTWHDGHNTLVCDSEFNEVTEHSIGNVSLVNKLTLSKTPVYVGKRAVLLGARGHGNYYHWLTDVLPKLEVLKQSGFEFQSEDVVILPRLSAGFQLETLEKFGISKRQIYQTHKNSPWITADSLTVPYLQNTMALTMGRWLPHFLKAFFLSPEIGIFDATEKIFVARDPGKKGGRRLPNYDEVIEEFKGKGFRVVFPEDYTVWQQAEIFARARVVAAPHGAGLTNIIFCQPGTRVIEYFGEHIAPCYWAICNLLDLRYTPVDCRENPNCAPGGEILQARTLAQRRQSGFRITKQKISEIE